MRSECREIRISLGAHALGQLSEGERATVEGHLAGCAECRAELESLGAVARLLPLAGEARITTPPPRPLIQLGERITATIGAEMAEREATPRRRRRRFGFAFGGVAGAAAAAVLAIVAFAGGGQAAPGRHIDFADVPQGVAIDAMLRPYTFGTEIRMYVSGVRSGTLCRVFLRADDGRRYPAGSFRYRWGEGSEAILGSALDLSRTKAIGVRAGSRTFIAPVGGGATASVQQPNEEEAT